MNSLAHIEINVSDIWRSKAFYDIIMPYLWWKWFVIDDLVIWYRAEDNVHLFLVQTDDKYKTNSYHRKSIWLNHIAFRVSSKTVVDNFYELLQINKLAFLYDWVWDYSEQYEMKEYYAVFFEDPDRIKLEVAFME